MEATMKSIQSYRDLIVWQKALDLAVRLYPLLKRFPPEERYGLADQIRRAAVSIPANIAEGQARHHRKEFVQGLYIARGSLAELDTLLLAARQLGYLDPSSHQELEGRIGEVRKMLQGLLNPLATRPPLNPGH